MEQLNRIPGGPPGMKWGNPTSELTYGHAFIEHGRRRTTTKSIISRAEASGNQVGRYLDEDLAAAHIGAIAKRGPGVYNVPLPKGLRTEIALPDRSLIVGDMMRVVVKYNGTVKTSFPFRSDLSTTP